MLEDYGRGHDGEGKHLGSYQMAVFNSQHLDYIYSDWTRHQYQIYPHLKNVGLLIVYI